MPKNGDVLRTGWTPACALPVREVLQIFRHRPGHLGAEIGHVLPFAESFDALLVATLAVHPKELIRFHFPVAVLMDDMALAKTRGLLAIKLLFRRIPIDNQRRRHHEFGQRQEFPYLFAVLEDVADVARTEPQ